MAEPRANFQAQRELYLDRAVIQQFRRATVDFDQGRFTRNQVHAEQVVIQLVAVVEHEPGFAFAAQNVHGEAIVAPTRIAKQQTPRLRAAAREVRPHVAARVGL